MTARSSTGRPRPRREHGPLRWASVVLLAMAAASTSTTVAAPADATPAGTTPTVTAALEADAPAARVDAHRVDAHRVDAHRVEAHRVEAHSADLLVVGLVQGDQMSIRLSRLLDNAPVHDAVVAVVLRGAVYPAVAEADGSYALSAKDLTLPGDAAVQFQITQGQNHESLEGILKVAAAAAGTDDRGNGRQMWWWVLNFGVCGGFLWLFSRRKPRAQE